MLIDEHSWQERIQSDVSEVKTILGKIDSRLDALGIAHDCLQEKLNAHIDDESIDFREVKKALEEIVRDLKGIE